MADTTQKYDPTLDNKALLAQMNGTAVPESQTAYSSAPVPFDAPPPKPAQGPLVPFDGASTPPPVTGGGGPVPFDGPSAPPPVATPAAAPATDALPPGATDFGNGMVKFADGQVLPRNHPEYAAKVAAATAASGGAPAAPAGAPPAGAPAGANTIPGQAAAASTYSATPGADADQSTMNQGAQDVYRNSLLKQATQSTDVDTNDPTFRKIADTNAAAQERARRNANDMAAEGLAANGGASSGAMDAERRMNTEKSAQASAGFESQLALGELQNKRSEIQSAIQQLGSSINSDQARALQKQLADLDATIKRESLAQSGQLGNKDIDSRNTLGTAGLNLQGMGMLLNNQQNNNQLGATIGMNNATLNQNALRTLMGL